MSCDKFTENYFVYIATISEFEVLFSLLLQKNIVCINKFVRALARVGDSEKGAIIVGILKMSLNCLSPPA